MNAIEWLCLAILLLAGQAITTALIVRRLDSRVAKIEREAEKP